MSVLAIIPARGGSKGVPGKNGKELNGKPLIHYSIDVALGVPVISDVVVSSDCDKILSVSAREGVFCSKRPEYLAGDSSNVIDTILYEIEEAKKRTGKNYEYVLLLQPTSPFREVFHILEAIEKIQQSKANSLISVTAMDDIHPARMYNVNSDGLIQSLFPEWETARRQDIPPVFYRNGAIYLAKISAVIETRSVMCKPSLPYVMDTKYLANIDNERDWIIAEALAKNGI